MAIGRSDLARYCDELLEVQRFRDYCPNGLQVEGRETVQRLACAVTANHSVLEEAAAWGADALLVHHGYFWRGEPEPVVGMKRRRLGTLLAADMSLLAYHLPLDAHATLGNNAQLGLRLGVACGASLDPADAGELVHRGRLPSPLKLRELCERLAALTGREPLLIGEPGLEVEEVSWCTGAAQGYLERAAAAGAAVYISGEISEQTVHSARELGVAYIAAGHHATERYGVQALAAALSERFSLEWQFFDCDNPV